MELTENSILIIGFAAFVILAILIVILIRQQAQIKRMQAPKYGFLGKPILGIVATVVMFGGIFAGVTLINDQTTFTTEADLNVTISYEKTLIAAGLDSSSYSFRALPMVDDVLYGEELASTFDIYWNFVGPQNVARSELRKSTTNPSGIDVTLQRGSYKLYILVIYKGESYTEVFDMTV